MRRHPKIADGTITHTPEWWAEAIADAERSERRSRWITPVVLAGFIAATVVAIYVILRTAGGMP